MKRLSLCIALALLLATPLLGQAAPPSSAPPSSAPPSGAAQPKPAEVGAKLVLSNAKIAVGDGRVIDKGSILIESGKIVRIEAGSIAAADATNIDLGGKLVTPGLIAADTEIGLVEIGLEDSTRDDSRRDVQQIKAGYDPAPAINADSSLIAIQAIEGVTTVAVAPHGGLISGSVAWVDMLPGAHGQLVARDHVAITANLGRSVDGSRAASLAQLRRALEDARWYRANERNYERNQARPLAAHPDDLRALWPVLDRQIPLVVRATRASDLLALAELAEEFRLTLTLVGASEAWKVADALAKPDISVVVQPSDNLPGSFDSLGARLDNAALLHRAGVRVAIAIFDSHNLRNVTQEAGIAVANGLPHDAALTAVTLNVAKAYGMDKDYGTIAVGKVASLVVWDGKDPFELSCWAERVWVRGRELDMTSRQTQLRDRYMDLSKFSE